MRLAADTQPFAAGGQHPQVRAMLDKVGQCRRCLDHLLQVVEDEQHLPLADVLRQPVARTDTAPDRLGHETRIAQRSEAHPEDAVAKFRHQLGGGLQRETGFARTARAGQGQ